MISHCNKSYIIYWIWFAIDFGGWLCYNNEVLSSYVRKSVRLSKETISCKMCGFNIKMCDFNIYIIVIKSYAIFCKLTSIIWEAFK